MSIHLTQRTQRNTKTRNKRRSIKTEDKPPLDPAKARERVFQRASKLLAAKPRSVEELRKRLLEGRDATKAAVEAVIERLREYGYLDDASFAHSFASLRVQQRPIGRQRLQRDLWLKKIDKATANEALELVFAATPEEELIERAIEKRLSLHGRPQSRAETKKLFDHLLRQGFGFELIGEKLREISNVDVDEDV